MSLSNAIQRHKEKSAHLGALDVLGVAQIRAIGGGVGFVPFVPFVPSVSVRLERQPMTRERGQIKPLSRRSRLVFLKETDGIETDGI